MSLFSVRVGLPIFSGLKASQRSGNLDYVVDQKIACDAVITMTSDLNPVHTQTPLSHWKKGGFACGFPVGWWNLRRRSFIGMLKAPL